MDQTSYVMDYHCGNCNHSWQQRIAMGVPATSRNCPNCGCNTGIPLRGVVPLIRRYIETDKRWYDPDPLPYRHRPRWLCNLGGEGVAKHWAIGLRGAQA